MDLSLAVERHRRQLARIVDTLFAMLGLAAGGSMAERVSKPVCLAVLRLLRPAESAVRRLIVATARGLVVKPPRARSAPAKPVITARSKGEAQPRITFRLFDPRQRFASAFTYEHSRHRTRVAQRPQPRIRVLDVTFDPRIPLFRTPAPASPPPPAPAPAPDETVSALRLGSRLAAIKAALEDLPRQAKRYARWQARPRDTRRPNLASALRPGRPPGHRKNPVHKVDWILSECDWLARQGSRPDSS